MKLKRFLLRYNPPGVGLELQDSDGKVTVKHLDLPDKDAMADFAHIEAAADNLLESEPGILSRRRHRPALLQLLGRLYETDVLVKEKDQAINEEKPHASTESVGGFKLEVGKQVVLRRLEGDLAEHNGDLGWVTLADYSQGIFHVAVPLGDMSDAPPSSEPSDGAIVKFHSDEKAEPIAQSVTKFEPDMRVAIRGLRNHKEMNGSIVVVRCELKLDGGSAARYEVRAQDSDKVFRVKQENLVALCSPACSFITPDVQPSPGVKESASPNLHVDAGGPHDVLTPGTAVILTGFKTRASFNDRKAVILAADPGQGLYQIKLREEVPGAPSSSMIKTIRRGNLIPIKGTPRALCETPR